MKKEKKEDNNFSYFISLPFPLLFVSSISFFSCLFILPPPSPHPSRKRTPGAFFPHCSMRAGPAGAAAQNIWHMVKQVIETPGTWRREARCSGVTAGCPTRKPTSGGATCRNVGRYLSIASRNWAAKGKTFKI